jgi:hypothetical protein
VGLYSVYTGLRRLFKGSVRASSVALGRGFVSQPHIRNRGAEGLLFKTQLILQVTGWGRIATLYASTLPYAGVILTLNFSVPSAYAMYEFPDIEE